MERRVPTASTDCFQVTPAAWARFKALAAQNANIRLPQTYFRSDISQLNAKQLAKVNKLIGALSREEHIWVTSGAYVPQIGSGSVAAGATVANVYGPGAVLSLGAPIHSPTVHNTQTTIDGASSLPVTPATRRASSPGNHLPDVCPVTRMPYLEKKTRWSKNEELRLLCCLLGDHELTRGVSFLEYFHGARERQDLDRSFTDVEGALANIFNDASMRWPQYEVFGVVQRYPPTQELRLPRRPCDLISRWKKDIADSLKSFARAFNQSGRGSISEWDFATHPLAEFLYKVDFDLLVMSTGTLIQAMSGRIPSDDDGEGEQGNRDGESDGSQGDVVEGLQRRAPSHSEAAAVAVGQERLLQQPSTSSGATKRRRTNNSTAVRDTDEVIRTALQESISQQREIVTAFTEFANIFRDFMTRTGK